MNQKGFAKIGVVVALIVIISGAVVWLIKYRPNIIFHPKDYNATISTVEDVNGYYGADNETGKVGFFTCSKPIQAKVTRTIYPTGMTVSPNVPSIEPLDSAQTKMYCKLTSEGLPLENEGKITVLQRLDVQRLISEYNYKDVHLKALKFDYIEDKGFLYRLLPIYKGRDIGCIIVLETPGFSKVYIEDEKLQTFEELDYNTFSNYLSQASSSDRQLFLDNLH